jgi:hypothetical protein
MWLVKLLLLSLLCCSTTSSFPAAPEVVECGAVWLTGVEVVASSADEAATKGTIVEAKVEAAFYVVKQSIPSSQPSPPSTLIVTRKVTWSLLRKSNTTLPPSSPPQYQPVPEQWSVLSYAFEYVDLDSALDGSEEGLISTVGKSDGVSEVLRFYIEHHDSDSDISTPQEWGLDEFKVEYVIEGDADADAVKCETVYGDYFFGSPPSQPTELVAFESLATLSSNNQRQKRSIYQIRIDRNLSTPRVFEGVHGEGTIEKSMLKITLAV